jgi:hypothetical protein
MCFIYVSLLEPYHASNILRRVHEPPSLIQIDCDKEYEVDEIFDSRISNWQVQYLIHQQGYDIKEWTWELVKYLSNAMEKV